MSTPLGYKDGIDEDTHTSSDDTVKNLQDQEQQGGYDKDFEALTNPEHLAKDGKEGDGVRDAEDAGGNWKSNYGGNKSKGGREVSAMNVRAILKKRGPLGLIALLGLGGGLLGTALFSPGLLLVNMKESLVDRMNTQLTSMDARTTKILGLKVKGLTNGVCGSKITIKCRYATMSNRQLKKFEKAGIKVESTKSSIPGRVKPASFEFKGKTINASSFNNEFKASAEFRSALKRGYNPKYAGFSDAVWNKVAKNLGLSKAKALPEGDNATKEKALQEQTKKGAKFVIPDDTGISCNDDGCTNKNGQALEGEELKSARAVKTAAAELAEQAAETVTNQAAKAIGSSLKGGVDGIASFIKVTGYADVACSAYSSVRALGYAAKTVRAVQLAHYAMVFLNAADQLKAGTLSQADSAYLGGILTNVAYDAVSGVKRKAAMDSFGMQYGLYGKAGKSDSYVSQFMAGGGLAGDLIVVTDYINVALAGTPLATCKTLANPGVQIGSILAGVALMLIPGVNVGMTAGNVVKGIAAAAVQIGLAVLPSLLKDIVAGNVLDGIVGEDAGNAIASGAGKIMSDTAVAGGNGLMTVPDAVAYTQEQNSMLAQYAEEDRIAMNPLDPTNRNTFMGSIVSKLLPYTTNVRSVGSSVTNLSSFIGYSLGTIIPKSSALSGIELENSYTSCNDVDYKELGIATDPMCNPIFGVPVQYLGMDPEAVVDSLVMQNQIDSETGDAVSSSGYESFLNNCANRDRPFGDVGESFDKPSGEECIINSQLKASYALYTIDKRIQDSMDEGSSSDDEDDESAYELSPQTERVAINSTEPPRVDTGSAVATHYFTGSKNSTFASLNYRVGYGII